MKSFNTTLEGGVLDAIPVALPGSSSLSCPFRLQMAVNVYGGRVPVRLAIRTLGVSGETVQVMASRTETASDSSGV